MSWLRWLFGWLNRRFDIVSDDPYYAWADARLDELAEIERRAKQEARSK